MRHISSKLLIFFTSFGVCILALAFWQARQPRMATVDSGYRQVMGTVARILTLSEDENQARSAIAAAFEAIDRVDELMNDYDPNSMLSQLSLTAVDTPVPVDEELFDVLAAAKQYSRLSDGAFDVTIGPVVKLWRKAKVDETVPTESELAVARSLVGHENLLLDAEAKTVQFAKPGMSLDVGGIAKGYAIDRAIQALQDAGLAGGMVDIGGDLRCFGTPANRAAYWLIGLQDPKHPDDIMMVLNMNDRAVATSGDYQRFVVIDGQKHSHIKDPKTADSAQSLSSVSIIAPNAMAADALATAVTVLGKEKGMALIEKTDNTEALLIDAAETTQITKTTGAEQYIQKGKK
ncbi:MAG: FAD:protein FMN transferase [Planctomycetota bacterium]|jgi:thiamine biosynthesis lipoprotein